MITNYTVLIIDDHPLISNAYESAFKHISTTDENYTFSIDIVDNCDNAVQKINIASKKEGIDIIFLDMRLPPSSDGKILSGEDLGILINELLPDSKIIVSTTFNDNFRVNSILKSVNPDGFLIKNDITPQELVTAIKTVISSPPYYSKSVLMSLRRQVSNDFSLDKIDRHLLFELSIGTKMTELPNILMMSLRGLHKRKEHLKEIFDITGREDRDLILIAKEKGFI
ncbi:MAG: response regulator [Flavobacteriaceae bacterium]|nr:response regulator [Flavobacteriaceae bacterium]